MSEERTWLEKISHWFSSTPETKTGLIDLLREIKTAGVIDAESLAMIEGVFQVSEIAVMQIMIPRMQMVSLNQSELPNEFIAKIAESGHSRFPVFDEKSEQVIGILLAKDLLKLLINNDVNQKFDLTEYIRPVMVVPEMKRLDSLLQEFKHSHQHMAIAVDEYGSVVGLVTIEDVLEQIVGSIDDEYDTDQEENYIIQQPNGTVMVKSIMPLEKFNQYFNVNYDNNNEASTIGGYLLSRWHRIPRRNESIQCDSLKFTIIHADHRRLHLISVERPSDS
jgi:magnesium and cobalt transporter